MKYIFVFLAIVSFSSFSQEIITLLECNNLPLEYLKNIKITTLEDSETMTLIETMNDGSIKSRIEKLVDPKSKSFPLQTILSGYSLTLIPFDNNQWTLRMEDECTSSFIDLKCVNQSILK